MSYGLFFSDVLRSGLGYNKLPAYTQVELNNFVLFGPAAYPVIHLTTSNMSTSVSVPYLIYKYDTTSAALRALAEHLNVTEWTPCLLFKETCDETPGIPTQTVFNLLDSLVSAARGPPSPRIISHITLRINLAYMDRLHAFVLPWIFQNPLINTVQAISYPASELTGREFGICGPQEPRPYACKHAWTRFSRRCKPSDSSCAQIGSVWIDIMRRVKKLRAEYPNHSVETTVFERTNENQPEGLAFQGRRFADVVTIRRIRDCSSTPRQTVAVDDYGYEVASMITNTQDWYKVVATLRVIGQVCAWIRLTTLVMACYVARVSREQRQHTSVCERLATTLRTVFIIPSQTIVYGSTLPIACYVLAHLIDGRFVHELLSAEFLLRRGLAYAFQMDRLRTNALAMRSVWIVAAAWHILVEISTRRSWTPNRGIRDVPEFLLSVVVLPALFAHMRMVSWRKTNVLEIEEVIPSQHRARVHDSRFPTRYGFLGLLLGSTSTIDAKCLGSGVVLLLVASVVVNGLHAIASLWQQYKMAMTSRTIAPYTAGSLWQPSAMVVSWDGSIFGKQSVDQRQLSRLSSAYLNSRVYSLSQAILG